MCRSYIDSTAICKLCYRSGDTDKGCEENVNPSVEPSTRSRTNIANVCKTQAPHSIQNPSLAMTRFFGACSCVHGGRSFLLCAKRALLRHSKFRNLSLFRSHFGEPRVPDESGAKRLPVASVGQVFFSLSHLQFNFLMLKLCRWAP